MPIPMCHSQEVATLTSNRMVDFDAEDPMATRAPQTQADPCGLSMIGGCELVTFSTSGAKTT